MKKAGIIGATGYAGAELLRILLSHKNIIPAYAASVSYEGKMISDIFPMFAGIYDEKLVDIDTVIKNCDVVFASVPHGVGEDILFKCMEEKKSSGREIIFIDLGADFRLESEADYEKWYKGKYKYPDYHKEAIYGLPEIFRDKIKTADIIANPGCYPTSISLALYPVLENSLIETENIIIDSKSGVTGAGRGLTQSSHYPDTNEAFSAYKAADHRHIPEIEQTLGKISGKDIIITFTPHLLPVNRGIESTVYCKPIEKSDIKKLHDLYTGFYKNEKFVRIMNSGEYSNISYVRNSNYCNISLHYNERNNTLIICSCIDNLVKGSAGQAVQNMNIRLGFEESEALEMIPSQF